MESPLLGEKIEWEAKRVAAAFGIDKWVFKARIVKQCDKNGTRIGERLLWDFDSKVPNELISWCFSVEPDELSWIEIGIPNALCCSVWRRYTSLPRNKCAWGFSPQLQYHDLMRRGLYRLGFEDEGVLTRLNVSLTAHEKLELRLSMSREFWPQTWLDGEKEMMS